MATDLPANAPLIAIVGRPNVGKSTLFNRLVGGRPALVHDSPGLTRDRRYGQLDYHGHEFRVVDTGGLDPGAEADVITAGIHRQAHAALGECDVILFVVDARAGVTALDLEVASLLRQIQRPGRPVLLCANKIDHPRRAVLASELYSLGMGEVFPLSATHGLGVDDMLESLVESMGLPPVKPLDPEPEPEADADADAFTAGADILSEASEAAGSAVIRVAFVGKPNAGKSSLVNRLVGTERALVHHQPGTTTDPVDTAITYGGQPYVLVDTAGMRRKSRIAGGTEKIAVSMAVGQIERADVVVLVVDGKQGPSEQDARLAGMIEERGRAVIVALNKSDLLAGDDHKKLRRKVSDELHFLTYAPRITLSAVRGDGVGELMEAVDRVAEQHRRRIPTAGLNRFFAEVCETHPPPVHRGRSVRIHYLTQAAIEPPTFLLWANHPSGISPSYRRFVSNQLRARYRFEGTPLRVIVRAKRKVDIRAGSKKRGQGGRKRR